MINEIPFVLKFCSNVIFEILETSISYDHRLCYLHDELTKNQKIIDLKVEVQCKR